MSIFALRGSLRIRPASIRLYTSSVNTAKDSAGPSNKDGAIGKELEADGAVEGGAAEDVGGPFDKKASIGGMGGASRGTGQKMAGIVQEILNNEPGSKVVDGYHGSEKD